MSRGIRCGGPCNEFYEYDGKGLPEGWRYVPSQDPNAPRIELTAPEGAPYTIKPASGPNVAMCPKCAEVSEAAGAN